RGRPGGVWAKSQANHWILDGTRQRWAVAPVTNPRTGARNHPGKDYQCRCTATPVVDHLLGDDETPQVATPPPRRPPPPTPSPPPTQADTQATEEEVVRE